MEGVLGESRWNCREEVVVHEGDGRLDAAVLASATVDLLGPRRSGSLRRGPGCETIFEEEDEGKDVEARPDTRASCSRQGGIAEASCEPAFARSRHRRSLTDSAVTAAAAVTRPTRHRRTRSIYGLEGVTLSLACEAAAAAASPKAAASPRASPRSANRCSAFGPTAALPTAGQLCHT